MLLEFAHERKPTRARYNSMPYRADKPTRLPKPAPVNFSFNLQRPKKLPARLKPWF
ncbi:hypothetical protein THIOM_001085 [Candidatus Thiomargarita nelsonii]|uniref:Uncharacterized protein n=1 Tax=Candidatus Thiomargarita nelsonii TaxID=1003181 RepID=A0A176S5E8_9GAMM|nr:hypothetical protein THIOM_001085 [Candidatus Thiomargarita nelsonii]